MKWDQVNKYYMKSVGGGLSFTISKSMIYEKVLYELWNGNKWLYKSENIEDAKAQAIQYQQEQLASSSSKAE